MFALKTLTTQFSVAGQLSEPDFAAAAAAGFATILNFRPDGEMAGQLPSSAAGHAAAAAGLAYVHLPAHKTNLFSDVLVAEAAGVLANARAPVLAYCASGQRAAIVWAAASARTGSVDDVLSTLQRAGFDLNFLRDDLEAQADRARWDAAAPTETATGSAPSLAAA